MHKNMYFVRVLRTLYYFNPVIKNIALSGLLLTAMCAAVDYRAGVARVDITPKQPMLKCCAMLRATCRCELCVLPTRAWRRRSKSTRRIGAVPG